MFALTGKGIIPLFWRTNLQLSVSRPSPFPLLIRLLAYYPHVRGGVILSTQQGGFPPGEGLGPLTRTHSSLSFPPLPTHTSLLVVLATLASTVTVCCDTLTTTVG